MSRVLVTGGAGYVGSECVATLLAAGVEVTVFDDLSTGHRAAIPDGADLVVGSLADAGAIDRALACAPHAAVLHFAARSIVGDSMADPLTYLGDAVSHATNLIRAVVRHGVSKLVLSSTAAVFGEPAVTPIDEEAAIAPANPYGEGKRMIERMLAWVGRVHGLRWASLRYFNAAGADPGGLRGEDHRPETHLIPIVLSVAAGKRDVVTLLGTDYPTPDGSCVRDYVHVCDLAAAHVAALRALDEHDHIEVNLGTGSGASVLQVIECAREVTGHAIPCEHAPRRPGDAAVLVADVRRAKEILEWEPTHDLESIVETAWRWHYAHPDGYAAVELSTPFDAPACPASRAPFGSSGSSESADAPSVDGLSPSVCRSAPTSPKKS